MIHMIDVKDQVGTRDPNVIFRSPKKRELLAVMGLECVL